MLEKVLAKAIVHQKKKNLKPLQRREGYLGLEHRDIGEEFDVFSVSFYIP